MQDSSAVKESELVTVANESKAEIQIFCIPCPEVVIFKDVTTDESGNDGEGDSTKDPGTRNGPER